MSKYKPYCRPSDFLEKVQRVNNTIIIVNSGPSTLKTGHWLCIFETAKNIEFFYPLDLPGLSRDPLAISTATFGTLVVVPLVLPAALSTSYIVNGSSSLSAFSSLEHYGSVGLQYRVRPVEDI